MEGGRADARPIHRGGAAIEERRHAVLVSCDVVVEILTGSWFHDYVDGRLEEGWSMEGGMLYQ